MAGSSPRGTRRSSAVFGSATSGRKELCTMGNKATVWPMRIVSFALAAVFSIVAVVAVYTTLPGWVGTAAIVAAGLFLVLGFYEQYKRQEDVAPELDSEQRATVQRMKAEGNFQLAVQQVQLWFRGTTPEDATRLVREA